jgi:hypothetical protein
MSPQMATDLQIKMGENSDFKVILWKKQIEESKSALLLLQEVKETQVPLREVDDMVLEINVDTEEKTLASYRWYSSRAYKKAESCLKEVKLAMFESLITEEVLDEAIKKLRGEKLPYFK